MLKEETELWLDLGWISLRCRGCVGGRLYGINRNAIAPEPKVVWLCNRGEC
jgi:hypothetical protein